MMNMSSWRALILANAVLHDQSFQNQSICKELDSNIVEERQVL